MHVHRKTFIECARTSEMAYLEVKERNRRKYFYSVVSRREGKKVIKKRKYLGVNLTQKELADLHKTRSDKHLQKIKPTIIPILKKNKIKRAGIFGSYARNTHTKESDIDILIEPAPNMGFAVARLKEQLAKALKKKVDLVSYSGLSPYLRQKILKEEIRIL